MVAAIYIRFAVLLNSIFQSHEIVFAVSCQVVSIQQFGCWLTSESCTILLMVLRKHFKQRQICVPNSECLSPTSVWWTWEEKSRCPAYIQVTSASPSSCSNPPSSSWLKALGQPLPNTGKPPMLSAAGERGTGLLQTPLAVRLDMLLCADRA